MKKFWKENRFFIKQIGLRIGLVIAFFVFLWLMSNFFELMDQMYMDLTVN